jgi:hypothetical protein
MQWAYLKIFAGGAEAVLTLQNKLDNIGSVLSRLSRCGVAGITHKNKNIKGDLTAFK